MQSNTYAQKIESAVLDDALLLELITNTYFNVESLVALYEVLKSSNSNRSSEVARA